MQRSNQVYLTSPHVFKFSEVEDRIIIHYKDWPEAEEAYRKLDVNDFVPDMRNLSNVAVNEKIEDILEDDRSFAKVGGEWPS